MKKSSKIVCLIFFLQLNISAQDTFSILAFDSITREVGAAGASCVNLFQTPFSNDFICELFPDTGAVASQAAYIVQNQNNARQMFRSGLSPTALISWLQANDIQGSQGSTSRQYGVIRMDSGYPRAAAFTGTNCMYYKNHIFGPNYSIHGNILLGPQVLDSMEARFKRATGDLACKLMAAMQGANMVGADSRCAGNNSSSLFAFLKVALPTDTFGKPSFLVSLRTIYGDSIEPIDSLQKLFDAVHSCTVEVSTVGLNSSNADKGVFIFPNPSTHEIHVMVNGAEVDFLVRITDIKGKKVYSAKGQSVIIIDIRTWPRGLYLFEIQSGNSVLTRKVMVE